MRKLKKSVRIGLYVLIILPVLVFLGFAGAVSFIDFNRYKPQIEAQVKNLTQRDFKIEGAVDVSVIPFAMSIGKSTLSNSQAFSESGPQLEFKELRAELSLSQLFLNKRLDVQSLQWIDPKIVFSSDEQGRNNWQDLPNIEALIASFLESNQVAETSKEESVAHTWQLSSLVIQDGQIAYQSANADKSWTMENISVVANQLAMDAQFPVHIMFDWKKPGAQRSLDVRMNSELLLPAGWKSIEMRSWQGVMNSQLLEQEIYPVVNLTQKGKGLRYQWDKKLVQLESWEIQGLNGKLQVSANGQLDEEVIGQATTVNVDYQTWSNQLNIALPEREQSKLQQADALIEWRYKNHALTLENITLQGKAKIQTPTAE
ncbi:AsmA family protein [Thiomicrorhabdus indica]|uniref:AsmA family protein n=1 Tax=Thiomicrorhabdus indica TaxID=2267253 RepID=UPI00102DEED2|nr:AsmA family protein [Thiomicrorhabdus indica]